MVADIFSNILGQAFQFGLSFLDSIFDATGMWPIYLGGLSIILILRFIVLPMLMSSAQADGNEYSREQLEEAYNKQVKNQNRASEIKAAGNNRFARRELRRKWRNEDENERYNTNG